MSPDTSIAPGCLPGGTLGCQAPKPAALTQRAAAVPGVPRLAGRRSHSVSHVSSSLLGAQPVVKPPGTGSRGCRLCRQVEDRRCPGWSCSGSSPKGAGSRLQHTGHMCTAGSAREMETVTPLAWHPSRHPRNSPSQQCAKGRFATGMERCKKGAWLLGLDMLVVCGQPAHGSPCTGESQECSPRREFCRNEEAKPF